MSTKRCREEMRPERRRGDEGEEDVEEEGEDEEDEEDEEEDDEVEEEGEDEELEWFDIAACNNSSAWKQRES